MKQIWFRIKHYLHWVILGGMLFFFAQEVKHHWKEVAAIRIDGAGWIYLSLAIIVTLLAFAWAGWVWSWTLQEFKQPLSSPWVIKVYLKTHIAKYLPGSLWDYWGRIWLTKEAGVSPQVATLSVVIEPFLMIAAALLIVLIGRHLYGSVSPNLGNSSLPLICLVGVLMIVHPWFLNPVLRYMGKFKGKRKECTSVNTVAFKIERYPLKLVLGEVGYLGIRGIGFWLTCMALTSVNPSQIPMLVTTFTLAWLAALVIPGAPGGVGVFEATAIALLNQSFSTGLVLSVVAVFRLVTVLAEATGAGLAYLAQRRYTQKYQLDTSSTEAELVQLE